MRKELRDYQIRGITEIRQAYIDGLLDESRNYDAGFAVLYQGACGSGKTVIFAYISENASRKNKRILILVPRKELLLQGSKALDDSGVDHGIIAPKHEQTNQLIQIASKDTLIRRLDSIEYPDMIIVDECHRIRGATYADIIKRFPKADLLGVTATPIRLDGKSLGRKSGGFFDVLIKGPTPKELIAKGYLAEPIVYSLPSTVDFNQLNLKLGDFDKKESAKLMGESKIYGNCIEHYKKICPNAPAIAFTISIKEAEEVAKKFNDAGIPAMSIDGKMSDDKRKYALDCLRNDEIKVLTSCELVSEGLDIPKVTCAIGLRPTASLRVFAQQSGRPLRPYPGKEYCYILDHVGNVLRHGSPIADRDWQLDVDMKPNKGKAPIIRDFWICDMCYASNDISADICAQCGEGRKVNSRQIKEIEGELQRIKEEEMEVQDKIRKKNERKQARTLEDLQRIEKERGYKRGWAEIVFNARGGM